MLLFVLAAAALYMPVQVSLDLGFERIGMDDDQEELEFLVAMGRATPGFGSQPMVPASVTQPIKVDHPDPINYVLWLNVSGFRADYVDKASAPIFTKLADESHSTGRMTPTFPSLHWSSLVSQATGLQPAQHGIIGETIRNPETGEITNRPTDLSLLKGEPIWTTAKRQGVNVLVHDWPFSQVQPDEHAADIYLPEFNPDLSDDDRLKALLDAWKSDKSAEKIRLVMASLHDLNKHGETLGARSDQTYAAFEEFGTRIGAFMDELQSAWPDLNRGADILWVFITTDHGMGEVKTLVNFEEFVSEPIRSRISYTVDDTIAHVWLNLPEGTNEAKFIKTMDDELGKPIFWKMHMPDALPEHWQFPAESPHIGERVLELQPGYRFTDKKGPEPVFAAAEVEGSPLATGGYAPSSNSRMRGQVFIFKFPERGAGSDLQNIYAVQLYPTICELLGIEPAEGADAEALTLEEAAMEPEQ